MGFFTANPNILESDWVNETFPYSTKIITAEAATLLEQEAILKRVSFVMGLELSFDPKLPWYKVWVLFVIYNWIPINFLLSLILSREASKSEAGVVWNAAHRVTKAKQPTNIFSIWVL